MNISKKDSSIENVVALGKFDGVHKGHQKLISTAVSIAKDNGMETLVCTIVPQTSFKSITTETKKEEIIKSLGADFVIRQYLTDDFKNLLPEEFVEKFLKQKFSASHVVVGYNFRFGANRTGDAEKLKELCKKHNIAVTVIDSVTVEREDGSTETISSTAIRNLVENGKVEEVNNYLGRFFCMWGVVSEGKHLGRTIGFPTINFYPKDTDLVPKRGVYAVNVYIDGREFYGITNVGINPTVEEGKNIKVETYIFNFDNGEIYGKPLRIKFLEFVRDEFKFDNIYALKNQIEKDKDYVLKKYL